MTREKAEAIISTKKGRLSLARSYWTYCYNMALQDRVWYLLGIELPSIPEGISVVERTQAIKDLRDEAIRLLRPIPRLSREDTYNFPPGLVRQVLNDIVSKRHNAYAQV